MKDELKEYYRLLAILENLKNDQEKQYNKYTFQPEQSNVQQRCKNLSLRKIYLWTYQPFERLKWMSILTDACHDQKGGKIISIVMTYNKQGDP